MNFFEKCHFYQNWQRYGFFHSMHILDMAVKLLRVSNVVVGLASGDTYGIPICYKMMFHRAEHYIFNKVSHFANPMFHSLTSLDVPLIKLQ